MQHIMRNGHDAVGVRPAAIALGGNGALAGWDIEVWEGARRASYERWCRGEIGWRHGVFPR
jgi:hypothetical protein